LTGIPVILNTSFNLHEEPVVCKPEDAVKAFDQGRLDALAIGNMMITQKRDPLTISQSETPKIIVIAYIREYE